MKDISKTDVNFKIESFYDPELNFYDIMQTKEFDVCGLLYDSENGFYRMPLNIAENISPGVNILNRCTAGGRIRFITDSKVISLSVIYNDIGRMSHFTLTGSAGFDLYEYDGKNSHYLKSFIPPYDMEKTLNSEIKFETRQNRQLLINFPTYSGIKEIHIGLEKDAVLFNAEKYKNKKPWVFYGSSITQGGCSSRPGTAYEALLCSEFNRDYINLGFSGNAKGELGLAEYIASLDPEVFFLDYDHNSPDADHLRDTHETFFRCFRNAQPTTPVIMMSRPKYHLTDEEKIRKNIIETTYINALADNDNNVYFIPGNSLMSICGNEGTVDDCHPTDLGFFSMAKTISRFIHDNDIIN